MTTTYLPEVAVTAIVTHGANPRRDVGNVDDLAASIEAHGLLEPLVVAPMNGVEYRLIAGHRRLAAARQAGRTTVPVLLREDLDTPPKQLEAMLIENTQRVDLTAVEEGDAYAQLVAFPGYTPAKAAKSTGRSVKLVKQRLAISTLPDQAKAKVHAGTIPLDHAAALAEFVGTDQYTELARQAGTPNFDWTLRRMREDAEKAALLTKVRDFAEVAGWTIGDLSADRGALVYTPGWNATADDIMEALTSLRETCEPLLLILAPYRWSIHQPAGTDTGDQGDDVDDTAATELAAARLAKEQHAADLETARQVRLTWLQRNAWQQRIGKDERSTVLRLLIGGYLDDSWEDEDLAMAYVPPTPEGEDDEDHLRAWVAQADEPALWRLLCSLAFSLGRSGWTNWSGPAGHEDSIRFAQALGYDPSDIERDLIEPKVEVSV